jgi:hypothetical protein
MVWLTSVPTWLSALVIIGGGTLLAMLGPSLVRRYVDLQRLSTNNEVAGFKFATVGVLYAVLLGFAIIVVWERFNDADAEVGQEAAAAASLYRLDPGFDAQEASALRTALDTYLRTAVAEDWPAMARGGDSEAVDRALSEVYRAIMSPPAADRRDAVLMAQALSEAAAMTQARRARVVMAAGTVPGVLWLVLFGGAVVTVCFTFFFGTQNLRAQTLMTALLALLVFGGLEVIVSIDHPFAGAVRVTPEALLTVLDDAGLRAP